MYPRLQPRLALPIQTRGVHAQVYYSPAFLRKSRGNLLAGLRVLASVYRAARSLFPLSDAKSSDVTIVHINELNAAGPADSLCSATRGDQLWLLVKTGDREAVVQHYIIFDDTGLKQPPKEAHCVLHIPH